MSFDPTQYTRSKFVKGADLDEPIVVTVTRAYEHTFDQNGETKPVLEFSDLDQDLILNKTNIKTMITLFGPVVDAWVGKRIMLIRIENAYQGQAGIRLQKAPGAARQAAQPLPESVDEVEAIPF